MLITVDYYDGKLPLRKEQYSIKDLPLIEASGVIFLDIYVEGKEPWGSPRHTYHMGLIGYDSYYLHYEDGALRFGGWVDEENIETVENPPRQDYIVTEDGGFQSSTPPEQIDYVLLGILMPDDEAREVGLIVDVS